MQISLVSIKENSTLYNQHICVPPLKGISGFFSLKSLGIKLNEGKLNLTKLDEQQKHQNSSSIEVKRNPDFRLLTLQK